MLAGPPARPKIIPSGGIVKTSADWTFLTSHFMSTLTLSDDDALSQFLVPLNDHTRLHQTAHSAIWSFISSLLARISGAYIAKPLVGIAENVPGISARKRYESLIEPCVSSLR